LLKISFGFVFDTSLNNRIVSQLAGIYEGRREDCLRSVAGTCGDVRISSSLARVNIDLRSESLSGVGNASADGGNVGFVASVFVSLRDEGLGGTVDTSGYKGIVVGLTLGLEDIGVVRRIRQTFSESARIVRFAL